MWAARAFSRLFSLLFQAAPQRRRTAWAVLLFTVLMTGMFWARQAWGRWWEWSPPLTFSLILWILYVAYMVIRRLRLPRPRLATTSAVFGLLASLDLPLVYLSLQFLPSSHLSAGERAPEMAYTLLAWVVAVGLLAVCMIWTRYLISRAANFEANPAEKPAAVSVQPAGGRA